MSSPDTSEVGPSRLAFVADVHIGNHRKHGGELRSGLNDRCRATLQALENAVEAAVIEQNCRAFVVCGDLFDTHNPTPQVVAAVQSILRKRRNQVQFILLVGNHDRVSGQPRDHALASLAPVAAIVEKPTHYKVGATDLLCVPFEDGPASEWLADRVAQVTKGLFPVRGRTKRVLAIHLGVADSSTPSYLREAHDSIKATDLFEIMEEHSISAVFAGNWHDRQVWLRDERGIYQCGALAPTGWDNQGPPEIYGSVVMFEPGAEVIHRQVGGPRFMTIDGPGTPEDKLEALADQGCATYARWHVTAEDMDDALDALEDAQEAGLIEAGHVSLRDEKAAEAAREAVEAATSATNLDEALAAWVGGMELVAGVKRDVVLAKTQGYLRGAS